MSTDTVEPLGGRDPGIGAGVFRLHPDGTASRGSRILGTVVLVATIAFLFVALVASPADTESENAMGDMVRIMYVHVPAAVACYTAFLVTAVGSIGYLWKRTEGWDLLAAASAEVGVVFTALTLLTGSIWGHIAWGTWWEWDARLTSTLVMFLVYIGYLALRSAIVDPIVRAKRSAIVGVIAFVNVPIVHYSVDWWRSLHQKATISRFDPTIDGLKLFALMFGMILATALYAWLMMHRFRMQYAASRLEVRGLDLALAERRAEAEAPGFTSTGAPASTDPNATDSPEEAVR